MHSRRVKGQDRHDVKQSSLLKARLQTNRALSLKLLQLTKKSSKNWKESLRIVVWCGEKYFSLRKLSLFWGAESQPRPQRWERQNLVNTTPGNYQGTPTLRKLSWQITYYCYFSVITSAIAAGCHSYVRNSWAIC